MCGESALGVKLATAEAENCVLWCKMKPKEKSFYEVSGACIIKVIKAVIYGFCNKLE